MRHLNRQYAIDNMQKVSQRRYWILFPREPLPIAYCQLSIGLSFTKFFKIIQSFGKTSIKIPVQHIAH